MPVYKYIPESSVSLQVTDCFGGYDHNRRIGAGEFYDMKNLCSDHYPMLATRRRRAVSRLRMYSTGTPVVFRNALGMTADANGDLFIVASAEIGDQTYSEPGLYKIHRAVSMPSEPGTVAKYSAVENYSLYANALDIIAGLDPRFVLTDTPKTMFVTGDELYIFPDKKWLKLKTAYGSLVGNTVLWGDINEKLDAAASAYDPITYSPCDMDGTVYSDQTVGPTAPSDPDEGDVWVDTSVTPHMRKKRSGSEWVTLTETYVKVSGIIHGFSAGDGIDISEAAADIEGSHIISAAGSNYIVVPGMTDTAVTQTTGRFTAERRVPDMDFIVPAQNRLWGCRYSSGNGVNEESVNEIYASKLGDFKNWNVFQGVSTDSYAASVGTPGAWTGAANINGSPVFFKEDHYHKVYVSPSGAHQIVDRPCHGVQSGCGGSLAAVDNAVFYKSKSGITVFDGSAFENIGAAFGDVRYTAADGGAAGDKYMVSMREESGLWSVFTYDVRRRLWHREDETHALHFTSVSGDAFFITEDSGGVAALNIISDYDIGEAAEEDFDWYAVTGLQGYEYVGQKYLGRFDLRMILPCGAFADVYIEYDSSGKWEHQGHIKGAGVRSFVVPVRPRRCDHFRIKLTGRGEMKLYSLAKLFEGGSDEPC